MSTKFRRGVVEILSTDFVIGWVEEELESGSTHVYASVGSRIVGFACADVRRDDLDLLAVQGELLARAFIIVFDRPIGTEDLRRVEIRTVGDQAPISRGARIRVEQSRKRQIFILGSPRSGTSELAATLVEQLGLPWMGEGHAAPSFFEAAEALSGDAASPHDLPRFMARQHYREIAIRALRRAYYFMHGSVSFLDKTPGTAMIRASTFLAECFPEAHFIYMRRNGISNVLSRVAKFGGPFDEHCADWAAAMDLWVDVRGQLPHYLEVNQEEMLENPRTVAEHLALYLAEPEISEGLARHLAVGRRELTGAGVGKTTLASTGWGETDIRIFRGICEQSMMKAGYSLE